MSNIRNIINATLYIIIITTGIIFIRRYTIT